MKGVKFGLTHSNNGPTLSVNLILLPQASVTGPYADSHKAIYNLKA